MEPIRVPQRRRTTGYGSFSQPKPATDQGPGRRDAVSSDPVRPGASARIYRCRSAEIQGNRVQCRVRAISGSWYSRAGNWITTHGRWHLDQYSVIGASGIELPSDGASIDPFN